MAASVDAGFTLSTLNRRLLPGSRNPEAVGRTQAQAPEAGPAEVGDTRRGKAASFSVWIRLAAPRAISCAWASQSKVACLLTYYGVD